MIATYGAPKVNEMSRGNNTGDWDIIEIDKALTLWWLLVVAKKMCRQATDFTNFMHSSLTWENHLKKSSQSKKVICPSSLEYLRKTLFLKWRQMSTSMYLKTRLTTFIYFVPRYRHYIYPYIWNMHLKPGAAVISPRRILITRRLNDPRRSWQGQMENTMYDSPRESRRFTVHRTVKWISESQAVTISVTRTGGGPKFW